ncbi:MAG: hypothetical protein K9L59_16210 [Desulfobacterales bacterium]|nr:hypothetical protein [Desulfobacterales bacterium]
MRIENLTHTETEKTAAIRAKVRWEDCSQPDRDVFIETEAKFSGDLSVHLQPFVVGCLVPALHFGERRIAVDGSICPYLLEGLETVMALMQLWSGGAMQPLLIEPAGGDPPPEAEAPRAGMLLSGGIDSLAALRLATLRYGAGHPARPRDALLVHGFDIGGVVERGAKYPVFERAKNAMAPVADEAGMEMIPVYTNLRHLCDDRDLWLNFFFGAVLAAVAHAFGRRMDLVYIASSYDLAHLHPCGSHPLLDPAFSSFGLRICHRDTALSRMEKLKIVSQWRTALDNLRVCLANVSDRLNCGRCEKCVRTMTGLAALGRLDATAAFVEDDVDCSMFDAFKIVIRERGLFYEEMIPYLRDRGRQDLVDCIRAKLAEPPV